MKIKPVVLVLASGKGERFRASGGTQDKLAASLAGVPVLQRVLSAVEASGLMWHIVKDIDGGMGDSIAAGVSATADADGWLILPGDLPLIRPHSIQSVAHALESHAASCAVVVPHWHERHGHPVGFRRECFTALMALSGDAGAASVVKQHRLAGDVLDLPLDDVGIVTDIDTVDDLAHAEALLRDSGEMNGKH
jgi:molybdenum cofactor cytidylyltransferase